LLHLRPIPPAQAGQFKASKTFGLSDLLNKTRIILLLLSSKEKWNQKEFNEKRTNTTRACT
jgi:hypothetical protein